MMKKFNRDELLLKYPSLESEIKKNSIDIGNLKEIYGDYTKYRNSYENQANFIANILRSQSMVHSVKSRIKDSNRLIEKIVRKTNDRKNKYGEDFEFSVDNYKNEVNDLIGIRVIHIFKEQWREIHEFIINTWRVIEITANVRDGDNVEVFKDLDIEVRSRASGYRSVHYLIELSFTQKETTIAEIQVRTIFEEAYGEIDHQLKYSNIEIPETIASNLLVFNRLVGTADEMASLINSLHKKEQEYRDTIKNQKKEIELLKSSLSIDNIK